MVTSSSAWNGTEKEFTLAPETHPEASAVNAFYWVNFAHDKLYAMGFDEANRNCQQTNFNRGGLEEDLVTIVASAPTQSVADRTNQPSNCSFGHAWHPP